MERTKAFGVRFILRHTTTNSSEALIYVRTSFNKKRSELSVNRAIDPNNWNPAKQCVFGSKELMNRINPYLDPTYCDYCH
jgi:hypothetical protein